MGLPMENLHAPTVPSGPTSAYQGNGSDLDQLPLMTLMARKEGVEAELKALGSVLDSHGVNMNTSLTTFDGFPRDDIDIAQIRTTRARIIHLKNDYKDLMNRIEKGLHEHHASSQQSEILEKQRSSQTIPEPTVDSSSEPLAETPFAKVNAVNQGSPAQEGGLKPGDHIRTFGSANWMNHENLRKVGEIVQRNEGRQILVKVVRNRAKDDAPQEIQLQITPRRGWGGRGTLGCHLLPL